jgi:hypothetical protein
MAANTDHPRGEPTRQRHGERDSTIDHAWVTASLPYQYWGDLGYEGCDLGYEGSDHRAQLIEITTAPLERRQRAAEAPGWSWNSMDRDLVATDAKGLHLPPGPLDSPRKIDEAIDYLTAQLTRIADASTPRRKVSQGRAEPWWSGEVHQLRTIQTAKTKSWRSPRQCVARHPTILEPRKVGKASQPPTPRTPLTPTTATERRRRVAGG